MPTQNWSFLDNFLGTFISNSCSIHQNPVEVLDNTLPKKHHMNVILLDYYFNSVLSNGEGKRARQK